MQIKDLEDADGTNHKRPCPALCTQVEQPPGQPQVRALRGDVSDSDDSEDDDMVSHCPALVCTFLVSRRASVRACEHPGWWQ